VDAAAASDIEAALADAKKATEEGGVERMNDAFNRLQTSSHKLAEALYSQTSASGGAAGGDNAGGQASAAGASGSASQGTSGGGADDNVIDAEYVDVDENK
ncbi:MAG TPA: hypothetical protein VE842_11710, partial [Pyrinomonadaceae bacterium]|nr:hypothetical protein [Pyrinomonadaceae bacterium]